MLPLVFILDPLHLFLYAFSLPKSLEGLNLEGFENAYFSTFQLQACIRIYHFLFLICLEQPFFFSSLFSLAHHEKIKSFSSRFNFKLYLIPLKYQLQCYLFEMDLLLKDFNVSQNAEISANTKKYLIMALIPTFKTTFFQSYLILKLQIQNQTQFFASCT